MAIIYLFYFPTKLAQDDDGNHLLSELEIASIKQEIIGLMIAVPANIQSQLGDAVGVIADSDFWRNWDTLTDVGCNLPLQML